MHADQDRPQDARTPQGGLESAADPRGDPAGGAGRAVPPAVDALLRTTRVGALVTLRRDGRPQLSNVSCVYEPAARLIRLSTTDGRAKTANLRRDPRAALYATSPDFWTWAVAEGLAELSPVAADPYDAVVEELVEVYRLIRGEHPDWEDYRGAMVTDRRLVVRLRVARVYGFAAGEG